MLAVSIVLFFICVFLSMMMALFDQDKKSDTKTLSTLQWLSYSLYGLSSLGIIVWSYTSFNIQSSNIWIAILLMVAYSLVYFILAYKIPRRFANKNTEKIGFLTKLAGFISTLFSWISWLFSFETEIEDETVSEEDIRELINTGSEIEQPQKEFIENVFELDDTSVEEICTHRSKVITLDLDQSIDEWKQIIHDNRHTFYPICGKDDDDIIGVLDTRDYFRIDGELNQDIIINKAVDKPFFVAENTKADTCFHEMKNRKTYFAIVLDEYGGMTGIITLHDIIETLLGEMNEVDDEIPPVEIQRIDDNQWYILGSADLEEVQEALNIELPIDEYETFSGYALSQLGRIPDDGTQLEIDLDTMIINVREIKNHRIGQTIVYIKEKEKEENEKS